MAFEGLLGKLGPGQPRDAAPQLAQLLVGLSERFRQDTNEIKDVVGAEMAALGRSHARLVFSADNQRERLDALQNHAIAMQRRLDRMQDDVESVVEQLSAVADRAEAAQRTTRNLLLLTLAFSMLAFGLSAGLLMLQR